MAYTLETKVGDLLKDTRADDILEKHVPGITKNPMIHNLLLRPPI